MKPKEIRYEKVVEGDGLLWFLVEVFVFIVCWVMILLPSNFIHPYFKIFFLIISYIAVAGMIPNLKDRKIYWRRIK